MRKKYPILQLIHNQKIIKSIRKLTRSHLKNRILVKVQGGTEFQPTDILKYFEELKLSPNTEIGTKDLFEMAYRRHLKNKTLSLGLLLK